MKKRIEFWEDYEGSDDARAVQGGGGDCSRLMAIRNVSIWAARLWVKILNGRGETLRCVVKGSPQV